MAIPDVSLSGTHLVPAPKSSVQSSSSTSRVTNEPKTPQDSWVLNGNYPKVGSTIAELEDGKYFLGLMQLGNHTFIVAGVHNPENTLMLARFGKNYLGRASFWVGIKLRFGETYPSGIFREGLFITSKSKEAEDIQYRYDIHEIPRSNYQQFTVFMKHLTSSEHWSEVHKKYFDGLQERLKNAHLESSLPGCYVLQDDKKYCYKMLEDSDVDVSESNREELKRKAEELQKKAYSIHIKDSCRTTAVSIVSEFLDSGVQMDPNYDVPLPAETYINSHLGILPSSLMIMPSRQPINDAAVPKKYVLEKLYFYMLTLRENNNARDKFNVVNDLYRQIAAMQEVDIGMLQVLNQAVSKHHQIIDRHRGIVKFGSTNTRAFFDGLCTYVKALVDADIEEYVHLKLPSPVASTDEGERTIASLE